MKKLLLILAILLFVGSVSAWTIEGSQYQGTINFFADGTAVAAIDGYPQVTFDWYWVKDNTYEADYLWYTVNFTYVDGVITSPQFPGARLI